MDNIYLLLMLFGGVFCICAAIVDWNWFFENRRARLFVFLFGRTGARIFYAVFGVAVIIITLCIAVVSLGLSI